MSVRGRGSICRASLLCIGLLAAAGRGAAVQERAPLSRPEQVRSLLDAGRYVEAEAAALQLESDVSGEAGADSLAAAIAGDLLVEALWQNGKSNQPEARALGESVVRIKEARLRPDDVEVSRSIRNLARVRNAAGSPGDAIPLFERVVRNTERAQPANDVAVSEALNDLAGALLLLDRDDEAKRLLDRARARFPPTDRRLARTLEQIGFVFLRRGDYQSSRPLLERAVGIREAAGADHPDLAFALSRLALQSTFEGDYRTAERLHARARDIAERTLRPDHPQIAVFLRRSGTAAADLGDLADATSFHERALVIAEQSYGLRDLRLTDYLTDLANTRILLRDYEGARQLYERGLRLTDEQRGPGLTLAMFAYNLANLNSTLNDFVEARRYLDRAVSIWRRVLNPDHPNIARAFSSVGRQLLEQGRYAEARPLFERALAIRERTLGPNHPDVAWNLSDLARTFERQNAVSRAEALSARAIRIWEQSDTPDTRTFAEILSFHAELQARHGRFAIARQYYERALAIRRQVFGEGHSLVAASGAGLAAALGGLQEFAHAMTVALESEAIQRRHLRLTLRYLSERQSLGYVAVRAPGLDVAVSLVRAEAGAGERVFDAVIRNRALVLDEMAARRHVSSDAARPEVAALRATLASAQQRLANLIVRGTDQRSEQNRSILDDARREADLAERALAERSADFRREQTQGEIGLGEVRAALPANHALVAFARYQRSRFADASPAPVSASGGVPSGRPPRPVASYIAFVLGSDDSGIAVVPLGSAASIDALVSRWRGETMAIVRASSSSDAEKRYRAAGAALRQKIWDPIRDHLEGASTIFVVPDGTLNFVSLAALPVGSTKYLIDQGPVIHYLSAERDLASSVSPAAATRGLLAVGGAAFDDAGSFTKASKRPSPPVRAGARSAAAATLRATCGTVQSMQFQPLAGTGREVHDVARLWTGSPSQILENRDATERAFKREAPGRRVLHLATHGFFLDGLCPPAAAGTRSVGGLSTGHKTESKLELGESPLLLAGLALAGANRRAIAGPADEDGILTAEEVTALNLEGVEWAVLSACDTGLGEVKAGEGVFGLRRAFQIAGVRTVIMSLWSVDDQAARLWMRTLYERRLQKHLNTAEALHEASLSVLRDRRARGLSTHPFYWAGFVATGDWR